MKDNADEIIYEPIGIINTPFNKVEGVPIQPAGAENTKGKVKVFEKYSEGLTGLEGFSHIILLYHFHKAKDFSLKVVPFLDDSEYGIFATRAPKRPNAIGLSVVKLLGIENNILHIENIDVLDGTPLLDIKPYASLFDNVENEKNGWLSKSLQYVARMKSDGRFM